MRLLPTNCAELSGHARRELAGACTRARTQPAARRGAGPQRRRSSRASFARRTATDRRPSCPSDVSTLLGGFVEPRRVPRRAPAGRWCVAGHRRPRRIPATRGRPLRGVRSHANTFAKPLPTRAVAKQNRAQEDVSGRNFTPLKRCPGQETEGPGFGASQGGSLRTRHGRSRVARDPFSLPPHRPTQFFHGPACP
jgi:hypothetical protein